MDAVVLDSTAEYGALSLGESAVNSAEPYRIQFDSGIADGKFVAFDLYITASGGYETTVPLYLRVGNEQQRNTYTHDAGQIQFTVSNYGMYGLAPESVADRGGVGFVYPPDGQSNLYELSFLIASDSDHVSDAARNMLGSPERDFQVAPGGDLTVYVPSLNAAQRTYSVFNDFKAVNSLGLEITQNTYAYDGEIEDHIIIIVYEIKNTSDVILNGLHAALFADWDFPGQIGLTDMTGFDRSQNLGYMYPVNEQSFRGIAVLNEEGVASYRSIYGFLWTYDGFSRGEKWQFMTEGFVDTASKFSNDYSHLITTGPYTLLPGGIDTAAFALIAADSLELFADRYVPKAQLLYTDALVNVDRPDEPALVPDKFQLLPNYPNPFNPSTTIEFALDRSQHVKLEIFNLLGRKVTTLIDRELEVGYHQVTWDAKAHEAASGVYFYRLKGQDQTLSRKMLLLK
jgi:hypothetical protein